jgi:hypothetical protein
MYVIEPVNHGFRLHHNSIIKPRKNIRLSSRLATGLAARVLPTFNPEEFRDEEERLYHPGCPVLAIVIYLDGG